MANESEVLANLIRRVTEGNETTLNVAQEMLGADGKKVTFVVANRKLNPEATAVPLRAESPARVHQFHDVAGFYAYLDKYKSPDTVILGDCGQPEKLDEDGEVEQEYVAPCIYCVINEKAVGGFEVLTLTPKINPTFEPWQDMLGKKMPVTAFAEFLLANRRCIVAPEPKDLISIFSQVRGGIQITREAGRGNKSINSVTVTVNIQGKTQVDYVDLPESITVNLPIFVRESCQDIELDLLVSATPETGGIYVVASSSTIELAKINAFNAMLTRLAELSGVVVSTGKPAHAPWNYLK